MGKFDTIIQEINTNIADNNTQSITAKKLRDTLIDLTDTIVDVQDSFESDIDTEVTELGEEIRFYETNINNRVNGFETSVNNEIDRFETSVNGQIEAMNGEITGFETSINEEIDDITYKLDEIVEGGEGGNTYGISDFTITGIYKTTEPTIATPANKSYRSTNIINVNPGDIIQWTNFPTVSNSSYVLCSYDDNDNPVNFGNNNRLTYGTLVGYNFKYTIPNNVYKIGFVWNIQEGALTDSSIIQIGEVQGEVRLKDSVIEDIGERLNIDDLSTVVEDITTKVDNNTNVINKLIVSQPAINLTPSDFTTTGLWKRDVAEIDSSYVKYRAVAIIDVVEGQIITWHKWQHGGSIMGTVPAIYCYDNDGLPYNGNSARIDYNQLTTKDFNTGEYTFKIPSNCSYIGLAYNFTAYPVQDGAEIIVSEGSISLTDFSKELINNAVEQGDEVGGDSSKYYIKGNSNITYSSSKKLGIIAAGQSNIDGRNSYSDYPYLSTNPNTKVHFKNSVNGAFTSFEVTDGGQNNDWSFDAIVYNLLTESTHGNLSDIYVMKKSMGGTSIDPMGATDYHWTADYEFLSSETYSLLRSFESIIRAGVSSDGSNFDIKAMLWHQGEGDMQNEQVANRYYENLKNMLAYVRGVVGNPRLYFFCGNISLNRTSPGYVAVINAAYTKLASEDPYFKVVDMSNAQLEDGYHFNYQWSIYFGQKVYDLMIDAGIITGTKINPSEPT